jgi:hypothetical protein
MNLGGVESCPRRSGAVVSDPELVPSSAEVRAGRCSRIQEAIGSALSGRVFRRNLLIALVVGILLTLANQSDVIVRGQVHAGLFVKICFNFLIPFVVSSVSAYANRCGP